jgi:membrane associated rhomboid family serine protease
MSTTYVPDIRCYRHPDLNAAFRCRGCGRPICVQCSTDSAPDIPGCDPLDEPDEANFQLAAPGRPYLSLALIGANVAVAAVCLLSDPRWLSGDLVPLARDGAVVGGAVLVSSEGAEAVGVAHGEWYRLITAGFLHFGPVHLAFNMIGLWQAGLLLEDRIGRLQFGLIFTVALLGGAFGSLLVTPEGFGAGASGGVFGLFGALFVAERKGVFGRAGSSFGVLIGINLVLTFLIPGISIGGHIGGVVAGTFVAWVMLEHQSRSLQQTVPIVLTAGLSVLLVLGCLWAATLSSDPLYGI